MSDYWYRGVVQYNGGPPEGYVWATNETAALGYVWHGSEAFRDDLHADGHWIERRPMDCWERVPDTDLCLPVPSGRGESGGEG